MYDQYVDINKKFKSSVNLEFDLQNEEKIEEYIPTTDVCDVIKKYIKAVLETPNFKATTLSGPYGKGKSYLLLMILYLLSKRNNKSLFDKVCKKIKIIDNELYDLLIELDDKGYYFLPVIINNNSFSDLNMSFISALSNSLKQFGFNNIVPNTTYNEALSIINKWENEEDFNIFDICLEKLKINLNDLKLGLSNYDINSFNHFTDLFSCVSHGLEFFSMKSDDIVTIYKDINYKITKYDSNCKGMFIVFDEFGSFLNNQSSDFALRLNKIQSFAEMCNSSNFDAQMHFCCITHKDILLYKKDKIYNDAFDTIAGRFDFVRFNRSLDENYQILCSAIVKKEGYKELVNDYKDKYSSLINNIRDSSLFSKEQLSYIVNNGFPFNPLSLYILIQISEMIAQNERTLFTFLSDIDSDGFRYFISNKDTGLLNADLIYDYFECLIKANDDYKMHYYKVESLKKSTLREDERNIFKTIALIKIINDPIKLNCTISNIAMCLSLSEDECARLVTNLLNKKILKKNINDDSIDFAIIADKEIIKMINETSELRFNNCDIAKMLSMYDKNKYEISNEYNFNHKMVRYFKVIYLEASKIVQLTSLDSILLDELSNEFSDGLLINLINDLRLSQEQVKKLLDKSEGNIIIRYIPDNIHKNVINKLKELSASKYLCENKNVLSENAIKTLPLLVEDMTDEISTYLYDLYSNARPLCKVDYKEKNLKKIINKSFEQYYPLTVNLNNELVNKNDVHSVTVKARNNVIDLLLKQESVTFCKTSQEMTIYKSFNNCNKDNIVALIKRIICESNGNKVIFSKIIDSLISKPYGMRQGIIPMFVAQAIIDLSIIDTNKVETVILYNESVEVDLNAQNLDKACLNPSKYYFCYTKVNSDKIDMTYRLMSLFECNKKQIFSDNIKNLNLSIKTYITNLSPIIVKSNRKDNLLGLSDIALDFKDLFLKIYNNNYDLLFVEMPKVLKSDYSKILLSLKNIMNEYTNKIHLLYEDVIRKTKILFGFKEGNLKSIVNEWINKYPVISRIVFENKHKSIYNSLKLLTFNDESSINTLSFGCINCGLDDYNLKKYEDYFEVLKSFINKVENYNETGLASKDEFLSYSSENIRLSRLANTLYSNILETVEEYGDAVSNEEKALIYKKLLTEMLK